LASAVDTSLVLTIVRLLPRPVVRAFDAWSRQVARRRADKRRARWEARKAAR
jgi:hypothetical protein